MGPHISKPVYKCTGREIKGIRMGVLAGLLGLMGRVCETLNVMHVV